MLWIILGLLLINPLMPNDCRAQNNPAAQTDRKNDTTSDQKKEEYQRRAQARLDHINLRLNELRMKGGEFEAEAKIKYEQNLNYLELKSKQAAFKLQELKAKSDNELTELENQLDSILEDIDMRLQEMRDSLSLYHFPNEKSQY